MELHDIIVTAYGTFIVGLVAGLLLGYSLKLKKGD